MGDNDDCRFDAGPYQSGLNTSSSKYKITMRARRCGRTFEQAVETAYHEGVKAGLEAAKGVAEQYEGKPCKPAPGWSEVEVEGFYVGQLDASTSIAAGISSLDPASITRKGGADE